MLNTFPNRGNMRFLANFISPLAARIVLGRMLSEGINAELIDENVVWNNYMYSQALGGVKLLVHNSDIERAKNIIIQIEQGCYQLDDSNENSLVSKNNVTNNILNTFFSIALFLITGIAIPFKPSL
ncbi:hypothetical protein XBJ2_1300141 [Xenorhabdus bovienii str. Jollieti]|uniref:DUF2007 domain-containing protein n=1 Tax=Xenorhabdus bovienii (strain SS-2004) TaxID=406818 RepID=D3V202_XENBS|nr:hypothetical protein [Xenorhabdus bovienii]CBJ81696.1 hypothetical protein XBJ1_2572 [Xenorhabdus bovienii SS-2004]CDH27590.1 hypothetical protein XBJ2_1300141 [Xenorhabdus bovienii str. Jollieti]